MCRIEIKPSLEQIVQMGREMSNEARSSTLNEIVGAMKDRGYDPIGALIVVREQLVDVNPQDKQYFDDWYHPDAVFCVSEIQRAGDLSLTVKDMVMGALKVGKEEMVVTLRALDQNIGIILSGNSAGFTLIGDQSLGELMR